MSYDIYLLCVEPGESIAQAIERTFSEEVEEINPGLYDSKKEQRKQAIATALIKRNPLLTIFRFDYKELASLYGISEEEAKIQYRHLELNGPEDGKGIQIILYDDSASITVSYWHRGIKAKATFEEIWDYIRIIQDESGYIAYDLQIGKALCLSSDLSLILNGYDDVMNRIDAWQTTGAESLKL